MNWKKLLRRIALAVPILLFLGVAAIVLDAYLEHRRLIDEELAAYPAPGELVEIETDAGPARLHVHAEGAGDPTLVFLAGLGTSAPYFDFMPLYERLAQHYRIAVVERAGYGWSDIADTPRDLGTVLAQTRTALDRAGEAPPYVLFPHSMAGLEAVHWANTHPDEVTAVIGLDPLVPGYLERAEETASLSRVETVLARTGLMRAGPDIFGQNFPAARKGLLSEREAEIAETVFMRRTHTPNMWDEVRALPENARMVAEQDVPPQPFHAFVSGEASELWIDSVTRFVEATGGRHLVLDADHYLHLDRPDLIARTSRTLIEATQAE